MDSSMGTGRKPAKNPARIGMILAATILSTLSVLVIVTIVMFASAATGGDSKSLVLNSPSVSFADGDNGDVKMSLSIGVKNTGKTELPAETTFTVRLSGIAAQTDIGTVDASLGSALAGGSNGIAYAETTVGDLAYGTLETAEISVSEKGWAVDTSQFDSQIKEAIATGKTRLDENRSSVHAAVEAVNATLHTGARNFSTSDYSDTLMIGDSIAVICTPAIEGLMPGIDIDACSARSLENGGAAEGYADEDGVLDHVRADDGTHSRYIIETGNNDWQGMDIQSAEEIISCLRTDTNQIFFVTEMVTDNPTSTANTNATIADVCSRYDNVYAIDWHGLVEGREYELLADECHPQGATAAGEYATLVKSGVDAQA